MPKTIQAAGVLIMTRSRPIQFLLMQHRQRWDLPKGHAEQGESLIETALRETHEETGIEPGRLTIDPEFKFFLEYDVVDSKRGNYHKRVTYFLALIDEACEVRLTEHIGFRWFDWLPDFKIQKQTIDPLIKSVTAHLETDRA